MIKRAGSSKDKGRSRFEYKERSVEDVKKRAEQTGGRFDSIFQQGFDTFRAKSGENVIRVLPPTWDDHDHYGYDIFVHSRIGPDNSDYLCLRKMKGEPCRICDAHEEAKEAGETDEAKALQPNKKVVMWVIDRDAEGKDLIPLLWPVSWMADRDVAALCHDKRKGKVLLIDHPDDGYDLIIKRHGQGLKTRYTYAIDRETSPIDDDTKAQDEVLDFIASNPIPSVLLFRDNDYLEKVLAGSQAEKDADLDEDDDKSSRRRRSRDDDDEKPARGRSRAKDDDDDEEDEKPARRERTRTKDDDDDDEKPARRRSSRDDDDDDEKPSRRSRAKDDDDDDEDDEDEKPSRRRRSDDEDEDEEKPTRRSRAKDEDSEEDSKPSRSRSRNDDDEDDDEKPVRSRRGRDKDDDDDDDRSARRSRSRDDDEDDEKPARGRRR